MKILKNKYSYMNNVINVFGYRAFVDYTEHEPIK